MARDLDFRVRRIRPQSQITTQETPTAPKESARINGSRLLWIVILALLFAAAIGVWQFVTLSTPAGSSLKTPVPLERNTGLITPEPTDSTNNIFSPQSTAPIVQVYDSGAGTAAVDELIDKLKALGYVAKNLDKSQFEYDRTYIRYREGMQVEAEKIQSTMPERLVSLKEVKSAGLFDILILYGVK